MKKNLFFLLVVFLILSACQKDNESDLDRLDFTVNDQISMLELRSNFSGSAENVKYQWSIPVDTIELAGENFATAYLSLPLLSESKPLHVSLTVTRDAVSTTISKDVLLPKNAYFRSFGLGKEETSAHHNERAYDWYMTQYNTGPYSSDNCGPTLSVMATKWVNRNFSQSVEQARALYRPSGGWWTTNDIIAYLNRNNVTNKIIELPDINVIQKHIENGNLVILCIDHFYIRKESNSSWHTDKYYDSQGVGSGHFLLVKGYRNVDGQLFYETYDPWGNGLKYNNGIYKGRDRYYRSEDLELATANWWKYAIVVSSGSLSSMKSIPVNSIVHSAGN
jgi:hypothetical protein